LWLWNRDLFGDPFNKSQFRNCALVGADLECCG
jgi:hypothetical protein